MNDVLEIEKNMGNFPKDTLRIWPKCIQAVVSINKTYLWD